MSTPARHAAQGTSRPVAVTDCRDLGASSELPSDTAPASTPGDQSSSGRHVAAGITGAALAAAAVAGLHHLYRAGDSVGDLAVWIGPLLFWFSCLGGGIKLAMWGARPVTAAIFDAGKTRLTETGHAVVASVGVIAGAWGMWFTFRGGYGTWWHQISGETGWSLTLGVGQMLVAVLAGAALFTGGKYLAGLVKDALVEAGLLAEHDRGGSGPSHPALLAALIAGGAGLVILTAWLTPHLAATIAGGPVLPAIAAIAAVLVWTVGSNLGWWQGLSGLYTWATAASQKASATAAVIAVLMFSAGGLGLGWFTPATVPQAHAACPPDCGGGGGLDGPPGGGQIFQPPSQGGQQLPDYNSGNYGRPGLDQNSGISIYNENPASGQVPSQTGGQQSMQEPPFRANPDGSWQARNGEWSPPNYQTASPGLTQGPGRPNPDFPGNQANPGSQGGNQPSQQPAQHLNQDVNPNQQAPQQQPQQPNQTSDQQKIDDLTRQLQDQQQQSTQDRQRLDELTRQLRQRDNQKQQQLPRFPSKDKKKDDKDQQQDQDDQSGNNDLTALLLGAASTRRRKQDEQEQPDQQQGPDTQALAQDGAQMGLSLPGDIANTVSDSVNLGQSAGSAAQNFGSAAQAGASLASSAQSGAVNPMDAVALVQGVSGGISDTADAVGSGASIASTWLNEAGQGAQLAADANPQLKPQAEQVQQLTQAGGQVADLTGQVASGVSQVSGMANTFSGMGSGGLPDTSGASDLLSDGGSAIPMSGGSGLGGHLAQAPMEPPPTPTPPNYPEVPRTITPTPPTPSNSPEVPRTITPVPPSTSPSVPPSSSSPTPEPHLAPPVTAPGPVPEPPPATSAAPPPPSSTPAPESPSPQSTTPAPPATTTPAPPPVDVNKLRDLGYDDIQIANIQKIVQSGQGMSDQGINRNAVITALAVSLDESSYYNLPNDGSYYIPGSPIWNQWTKMAANNPNIANGGHDPIASGMTVDRLRESLNFPGAQTYPDGRVPSDHASLGLFQQQLDMWGTMPELLNPTTSAQKFYSALLKVPGWQDMSNLGVLAQRVQGSFSTDGSVYTRYITDATKIADALGVQ